MIVHELFKSGKNFNFQRIKICRDFLHLHGFFFINSKQGFSKIWVSNAVPNIRVCELGITGSIVTIPHTGCILQYFPAQMTLCVEYWSSAAEGKMNNSMRKVIQEKYSSFPFITITTGKWGEGVRMKMRNDQQNSFVCWELKY